MRFVYFAKRRLAPGHIEDDEYEIVMFPQQLDAGLNASGPSNSSWDGSLETELFGLVDTWQIRTDWIQDGQELLEFDEFLASTAAGETFTFDPDSDTPGLDVNPLLCKFVTRRFPRQRANTNNFAYSFQIRQVV